MDLKQSNHLKAYGIAFLSIERGIIVEWILNYRGGSFLIENNSSIVSECKVRGVSFELISNSTLMQIQNEVESESSNMDFIKLEKAPKIAVYAPPNF